MTPARISPFAAAAAALPPQKPLELLPELDDILLDLGELQLFGDCASQAGEDITNCRLFWRGLAQAAEKLDQICQRLREAGHE